MATKATVGLTQKVGQPDFGSIGASCQIEIELEGVEITDPRVAERIQGAYAACRRAIQAELEAFENGQAVPAQVDRSQASRGAPQRGGSNRNATAAQVNAINVITKKMKLDLAGFLQGQYGTSRPEELDIRQASKVIDELKSRLLDGASVPAR